MKDVCHPQIKFHWMSVFRLVSIILSLIKDYRVFFSFFLLFYFYFVVV